MSVCVVGARLGEVPGLVFVVAGVVLRPGGRLQPHLMRHPPPRYLSKRGGGVQPGVGGGSSRGWGGGGGCSCRGSGGGSGRESGGRPARGEGGGGG